MVRPVKLPVGLQAEQRPGLAGEIVSDLRDVNQTRRRLEHAPMALVFEVANPAQQFVRELRRSGNIEHGLLHAPQQIM